VGQSGLVIGSDLSVALSGADVFIDFTRPEGTMAHLAAFRARGETPPAFPEDTAHGALGRYIARSDPKHYQPTNIAFGLLPELPERVRDKSKKRLALAERALASLARFQVELARGLPSFPATEA
jgi:methylenetetrahydrofolate--tRNA-(uracil-5-)-methyltransferase